MSEYSERVFVLFTRAIRLSAQSRLIYLERECAGNEVLMRDVESLILSHERKDTFLDEIQIEAAVHDGKE